MIKEKSKDFSFFIYFMRKFDKFCQIFMRGAAFSENFWKIYHKAAKFLQNCAIFTQNLTNYVKFFLKKLGFFPKMCGR